MEGTSEYLEQRVMDSRQREIRKLGGGIWSKQPLAAKELTYYQMSQRASNWTNFLARTTNGEVSIRVAKARMVRQEGHCDMFQSETLKKRLHLADVELDERKQMRGVSLTGLNWLKCKIQWWPPTNKAIKLFINQQGKFLDQFNDCQLYRKNLFRPLAITMYKVKWSQQRSPCLVWCRALPFVQLRLCLSAQHITILRSRLPHFLLTGQRQKAGIICRIIRSWNNCHFPFGILNMRMQREISDWWVTHETSMSNDIIFYTLQVVNIFLEL